MINPGGIDDEGTETSEIEWESSGIKGMIFLMIEIWEIEE